MPTPTVPPPRRVLMTSPDHFEVAYVINPHMAGHVGTVDRERARAQWARLRDTYVALGLEVTVLPGQPGLPDMVFCANQTLPYLTSDGQPGAVMSRMHAPQRAPEVPFYAEFFRERGYEIQSLDASLPGDFEGMGGAIWHPGRARLYGGYGYRTDPGVYARLSAELGFEVVTLELTDPDFYHLDTCFCVLDERTVLIYPGAFTEQELTAVRASFPRVLEAPEEEARGGFACNAHCPDGRHVLIQRGSAATAAALRDAGYEVIELDTDEFVKAGGSVFCMKLMYW